MATQPAQQILPSPPPGSDWRTKLLWFLANTAAHALVYQQFDYGQEIQPTQTSETDPDPSPWMHVQCKFTDTVSQADADDQVFTLDVINYTGDLVDPSWNDTDFQQVRDSINNFAIAIAPWISNRYAYQEIRFYRRAFNPYTEDKPFADAGGPAKVYTIGVPMTGTGAMPPQVTSTVTEQTASRKHWGRFYLPTLAAGAIATSGRMNTATMDVIADAADALGAQLASLGFRLVVPTTSSGGTYHPELPGDWSVVPARTLQQVNGFRVDDVVDSHRRRRHKFVGSREVRPIVP